MKRSEIVKLITDFLWKSNEEYGLKTLAKKDAEELLAKLEEAGMKPPKIHNPKYNEETKRTYAAHSFYKYDVPEFVEEWEPESEEKRFYIQLDGETIEDTILSHFMGGYTTAEEAKACADGDAEFGQNWKVIDSSGRVYYSKSVDFDGPFEAKQPND